MDIFALLQKRATIGFGAIKDLWLEKEVLSGQQEFSIILTEGTFRQLRRNPCLTTLFDNYRISHVFDLKNPYNNTDANMLLYIFRKSFKGKTIYGLYRNVLRRRRVSRDKAELCSEYPETYFDYLDLVEKIVDSDILPEDSSDYEFGQISDDLVAKRMWHPKRFCKQAMKIRAALKKEHTVTLGTIADIMRPRPDPERRHTKYVAMPALWEYPVNYSKLREGVVTNCPLQKGDIVVVNGRYFLVYEKPPYEIHTSPNATIIRPINTVCPEYLYLYLTSETSKIIMDSLMTGIGPNRVLSEDLVRFPVVMPSMEIQHYIQTFRVENFVLNDISKYNQAIQELSKQNETVEDILNVELAHNIKMCKAEKLGVFLDNDLRELNTCYRHGAYKATLILAGSILEAVLIDWLSELHNINYFEQDYVICDRNGHSKRADLIDYINEIKVIKRPDWAEEADKAHKIRKKRNLVHAKLCMNTDEISKDVCGKVISYLKDVLETRSKKMKAR